MKMTGKMSLLRHQKPAHLVIKNAANPFSSTRKRKLRFTAQTKPVLTAKRHREIGGFIEPRDLGAIFWTSALFFGHRRYSPESKLILNYLYE
jgi:hypothetical protein